MSKAQTPEQIASAILSGIGSAAGGIGGKIGGPVGGVVAGIGALLELGGIVLGAAGGGPTALVAMRDEAKEFDAADQRFDAWLRGRLQR